MDVDYSAWRFWFDVLQLIGVLFIGVYTWIVNRSKANRTAIDRVDARVSRVQDRVTLLENDVRHLPDHDDLGAIHDKVNTVASGMSHIQGELHAINRTLNLINEHLLNGAKK
jgi:hypothetical protein